MSDDEDSPPSKPTPKWLSGKKHDQARRSNKDERRIAKSLGGKRIPRSGGRHRQPTNRSTRTEDGDISTPEFHVEHKRTERASLSLKREWLEKITEGARRTDKDPAIVVTFEQSGRPQQDWIMVPLETAKRLMGIVLDD